jgi:hypothetical protein
MTAYQIRPLCRNRFPYLLLRTGRYHRMSPSGQKAKYSLRADVFRFTPESGLKSDIAPCSFRATSGLCTAANRTLPAMLTASPQMS